MMTIKEALELAYQAGLSKNSLDSRSIRLSRGDHGGVYAGKADRREYMDETLCFIEDEGKDYSEVEEEVVYNLLNCLVEE